MNLQRTLDHYWQSLRPPKRLYKYGTLGLRYFDDRTWKERLYDKVDALLDAWEMKNARPRRSRHIWRTFFEPCSGRYMSSMADIRKYEQETGLIYADKADIPKEAAKWRKRNEQAQHEYIEKKFAKMYHEVEQGKSYMKELLDSGRLKKGNYDPKYGDVH